MSASEENPGTFSQDRETGEAEDAHSGPVDLVTLINVPEWKTILVDLVKKERMDVWSIDICELAEKYLERIRTLSKDNLRVPANAILASAILLKFKARKLRLSSLEDDDDFSEEEIARIKKSDKLYDLFEPELKNPRLAREGRVSLDALVDAIEELISKTKKSAKKISRDDFPLPVVEENIEEKTRRVYALISAHVDSTGLCLFSHLVRDKTPAQVIDVFVPLLFLCREEKVTAWQDAFWGEIFINVLQ